MTTDTGQTITPNKRYLLPLIRCPGPYDLLAKVECPFGVENRPRCNDRFWAKRTFGKRAVSAKCQKQKWEDRLLD
jgi:hypothetical protein